MINKIVLPLLAVLLFPTGPAHAKKMTLSEVPPSIVDSIKSHYPDAKNILVNKEFHFRMNLYEVKFKAGNQQNVVLFDRQGKPFGSEETIDAQQLPVAVKKNYNEPLLILVFKIPSCLDIPTAVLNTRLMSKATVPNGSWR